QCDGDVRRRESDLDDPGRRTRRRRRDDQAARVTGEGLAAKRDLLIAVLDTLVPAAAGFPESGALALDHVLAIAGASQDTRLLLTQTLHTIKTTSRNTETGGVAGLDANPRGGLLRAVERSHPEAFDALVRHPYDGFYSHPATIARLGLEPGPVQPRGHRIELASLPDLARVAARGPIFRRA